VAALQPPYPDGDTTVVEGAIAAVRLNDLQRRLPSLTRGEGVLESSFAGYRPAVSAVPG
jgi:ribosomal protection tetracycline resistance protein